ncbi:hypothetical protein LZ30DRAFT_785629 [Colletotrichum cereale]|nr:hypothetical protein LZ30DRAFT_785629 [Colletotrichum cereale]
MPVSAGDDVSCEHKEGRPPWSPLAPALGYTEKTVVLHSQGDLTLRIGFEQDSDPSSSSSASIAYDRECLMEFVVCSRSLAQASRFFDALLFGRFAEAQHETDSRWVVSLPDDCPESMYILLAIIHGRTDDISSTLSLTELRAVLVQADKYDMMSLLGPWIPKWPDPNVGIGLCGDKQRLALIAWKTGAVTLFEKLAVDLAQNCRLNDQGEMIGVEGFTAVSDELDDTGLTDITKRVRLQAIEKVFGLLQDGIRASYIGPWSPPVVSIA